MSTPLSEADTVCVPSARMAELLSIEARAGGYPDTEYLALRTAHAAAMETVRAAVAALREGAAAKDRPLYWALFGTPKQAAESLLVERQDDEWREQQGYPLIADKAEAAYNAYCALVALGEVSP